ncbi:MAG: DUF2085 domain-containing protein [Ignavibacteriae bacterium]|nr:DUF2085 domain-containing protein [Ignavibacteriota bacterium]
MSGKRIYFIFLSFTLIWNILIVFGPFFAGSGGLTGYLSSFSYSFFSVTCHQIDNRSFHFLGEKLSVCSRCSSVYWAFLFSVIIYPFFKGFNNVKLPSLWILLVPGFIVFLDAAFDFLNVMNNTFVSRAVTGALIGFVLPFYLIPGFFNFSNELSSYFKKNYQSKGNKE